MAGGVDGADGSVQLLVAGQCKGEEGRNDVGQEVCVGLGKNLRKWGGKVELLCLGCLGMAGRGKVWKMGEDERKGRGATPFVLWFWPAERGLEEMVRRL